MIHKQANFNFHLHLHLQSRLCNPEKYNFNHALFPFHRLIVIIQLEKLEAKATCAPLHQSRPEHTDQCSFGGKSAMQSNAMQYNTKQPNAIEYNVIQCNAMYPNETQCNALYFSNPMQHNGKALTIRYSAEAKKLTREKYYFPHKQQQ